MANLSARAGLTPVETKIPLNNDGVSVIQNFSAYDSQVLYGHVFVNASTPKRSSVRITVTKNGAGDWEVSEAVLSGDDEGGSPLATFAMNGSALQATLPNYAGFVSAYIQYALQAPALGGQFPLSVDGGQVVSGTIDSDRIAIATEASPGILYNTESINVRGSEGAGTTTLTRVDAKRQIFALTAARTVVLPSTGIRQGEKIVLENRGAFLLSIQSSNTNTLTDANTAAGGVGDPSIERGKVELIAMQDAPTAAFHWLVSDVNHRHFLPPLLYSYFLYVFSHPHSLYLPLL
jgi:hypothetical protein